MLYIKDIKEYLPHRYPFMLVDRVTDVELGVDGGGEIKGFKNVTINEHFFLGHFPKEPIMPGVLIVEAMAQLAGILGVQIIKKEEGVDKTFLLAAVESARFKRTVVPGDQLMMTATFMKHKKNFWKFDCVARVDGKVCANTEILMSECDPF